MIDFEKLDEKLDTNKKVFTKEKTTTPPTSFTNKVGRKPLPEDQKKSEKITIYLTSKQREQITEIARTNYMTTGDFIVKTLMESLA